MYFFAIFLSGEIGKHIYLLQTLLHFSNPEQKRDELDLCQFYWKKIPIFRGFRLLVSVSTKEESSLKVIIFATSVGKNQSRFEWQPIRQYVVFWILDWFLIVSLQRDPLNAKIPRLNFPTFQYFWYEMTNLLDFGS